MRPAVLFLEPRGTALEVVRSASQSGYTCLALTCDPGILASVSEPYSSAVPFLSEVRTISNWKNQEEIESAVALFRSAYELRGVYSAMDPCAYALASIRSQLGLPTSAPEAIRSVLNKYDLRQSLRNAGLSTLSHYSAASLATLAEWPFAGAGYFKPVHGFFSAHVRKCHALSEVKQAESGWRTGASTEPKFIRDYVGAPDEFHLEEAIEGELLSVEGFSRGGEFQSLGLLSRILYTQDHTVEMGSCFPYHRDDESRIVELVAKAHSVLGLTDGPTHTEIIVAKDGRIEIIDLNPRFVGADVLQSINNAYDLRIQDALLEFALGKLPTITARPIAYSCLQYALPPAVSEIQSIELPSTKEVKFASQFIKVGTKVQSRDRQIDYLACYLTVMPSFESALERSRTLRDQVVVNGSHMGVF